MKKAIAGFLVSSVCVAAQADVGVFAGVTYLFNGGGSGDVGLTVKLLTSNKEDKAVGAVGVNFYPNAKGQQWGVDVGAGYQGSSVGALVGYDLLNNAPTVSGGISNTKSDDSSSGRGRP